MGKFNLNLVGSIFLVLEGIAGIIYATFCLATVILSDQQTNVVYWIIMLLSIQISFFGIIVWRNRNKID